MRPTLMISKCELVFAILALTVLLLGFIANHSTADTQSKRWTDKFDLAACTWSSTGRNDFFVLEPGYQQVLESRDAKELTRLEITVLNQTRKVGNIETRIVEEKESRNGRLVEISRNFFAVCGPANDVFYFGEEVDIYKDGKVDSHDGAWVVEQGGAKAGLFMPSRPLLGARYYQEIAPEVAMDRVEIVSDSESLKTPGGEFHDCVKAEETTPLEPGVTEYKIHAKGIGIVQDGDLFLIKYGKIELNK